MVRLPLTNGYALQNNSLDYMTNWEQWLDVQNGANLKELGNL